MNTKKKLEDEINFKDAFTNPMRMFGLVFILFIGLLTLLGIYYVKHLGDISGNVQPIGLMIDSANVKKEIVVKKGAVSPAVDLALIKNPKPDFIAKGKSLFDSNCKSCHGDNGMGDGPAGAALNPKPRNFHAVGGWTNGRTVDLMYKTLQEGIIKNGMASYEYLTPEDRFAIISYIRTFVEYPPIKDEELKSLDSRYQISKGVVVPAQISVKMAEANLEEENSAISEKIADAKVLLNSGKENPGALLLKKVLINPDKVFTSFINFAQNWKSEKYISTIIANPINSGFKPAVTRLSKEELQLLYDYIKTVTM